MIDLIPLLLPLETIVPSPVATPDDTAWLGPVVLSIGSVIVAIIGGASLVWRRRQDRKDALKDKTADAEIAVQPKVVDGWDEVRAAQADATAARREATLYYNLYRAFENPFWIVFGALRHLARTVRDAHPDQVFDKDIVDALAVVPPDTSDVSAKK